QTSLFKTGHACLKSVAQKQTLCSHRAAAAINARIGVPVCRSSNTNQSLSASNIERIKQRFQLVTQRKISRTHDTLAQTGGPKRLTLGHCSHASCKLHLANRLQV